MKMKTASTLSLLLCVFSSTAAWAQQTQVILDKNGVPIFQAKIFSIGDGNYTIDYDEQPTGSTWNLSSTQTGQLLSAMDYWAEMIQAIPGQNPAIINIGTLDEENADAFSPTTSDKANAGTQVHAAITNQNPGELTFGAHGVINLGTFDWADGPYVPSQILLTAKPDMMTVVLHEVAHTLGIGSDIEPYDIDSPSGKPLMIMPDALSLWDSHLYDDNNKQAQAGQVIYCGLCENVTEDHNGELITPEDIFDARENKAYFGGSHVSEVMAGAMPGVPLSLYSNGAFDLPVWSHLELKNSLMSHQNYGNYTNFMEAEVAVLQDLGYQIDRRNFWGYSVYADNQHLVNDNPFFARNAGGTAYLPNTYNTATLGLGLHVYGSGNTIVQRADLLSAGAGGGGIRVDGQGNNLTVLSGTRVHANGANGRGVMFAYGKDHTFTQRGDIEALGENGIAASFDFGHNSLGDSYEYRGSYIRTTDLETPPELEELNGPLVKTVDVTGRLAGKYASIYASANAYVGAISVMDRAVLEGDIISEYNQVDENNNQRITTLAFGYQSDADGRSTGISDKSFAHSYDGNIVGINNLSLQLVGGTTQLSGSHALYEVDVAQGATLAGSSDFQINDKGVFTNQGKVAPSVLGNHMSIDGSYVQTSTGELVLTFDNQSKISSLVVQGNANIDGAISFAATPGYYANGFSLASDQWVQADTIVGAFSTVTTQLDSPTLTATAATTGVNRYSVAVTRSAQAYSQYGTTPNSRAVGDALYSATSDGRSPSQALLTALDFSAPDGSTIQAVLPQLTGEAYASAKGVLINTNSSTRTAVWSRLQQAFGASSSPVMVGAQSDSQTQSTSMTDNAPGDLRQSAAWGYGFGNWSHQKGNGNAAKTTANTGGFVTGIDATVADDWRVGLLAGYSHSSIKVSDRSSSGSSDNYTLGAYTGTEWLTHTGALAFRSGLSYTWHQLEMDRKVSFSGFNDKLSSDYNAGTFQLFGELGYKAKLTEQSIVEPYANLAFVNLKTDRFTEKGMNGAALSVRSDTMNTTFSTLGVRASTRFALGAIPTAARADIGWRHAFGDKTPYSVASLGDSNPFSVAGSPIGKDTAIFETGLDFSVTKHTTLGVAYQGQFGSGVTQNTVNLNLNARF